MKKLSKLLKKIWQKWRGIRKSRRIFTIVAVVIVAIVIGSRIQAQRHLAASRQVVPVTKEDLQKEVIRSGQVELQGVVEVTPPISGVITDLLVENGQQVEAGQLLFKMKSNATAAELNQAWSTYLQAKNEYEQAKSQTGVEEWNEFEQAKAQMMEIEEQVKAYEEAHPDQLTADNKEYQQLKLNQSMARRKLDAATLAPSQIADHTAAAKASYQAALAAYNASRDGSYTAPIAGRIENIGINQGESVIAEVGDKEGTPLFLLVPDGKKTISMQIGPNDAMVLQVGQSATVKTEYVKDHTFTAQVVRVDKVGKNVEGKGLLYRAWLEVDDDDNQLLLGIPVEISIVTAQKTAVLTIPVEAIHDNFVTLQNQGKTEERAVEVGLKANGKAEIVTGLQEGDQVVIVKTGKP